MALCGSVKRSSCDTSTHSLARLTATQARATGGQCQVGTNLVHHGPTITTRTALFLVKRMCVALAARRAVWQQGDIPHVCHLWHSQVLLLALVSAFITILIVSASSFVCADCSSTIRHPAHPHTTPTCTKALCVNGEHIRYQKAL